ncbi:MAG: hypothetical protein J1E82_09635 [Muribaculaceae bacterium]|nr:hypothetical protein [Muribaculaceae bacterium]
MKKLFLSLAVVFSVAMVSCGGNKAEQNAEEAAPAVEEVVAVEQVAVDSPVVDSPNADSPNAEAPAAEQPAENK